MVPKPFSMLVCSTSRQAGGVGLTQQTEKEREGERGKRECGNEMKIIETKHAFSCGYVRERGERER